MADSIVYEQPLNERIRSMLRLEKLFQQYDFHIRHDSYWNNLCCIESLLELLTFTGRGDIKLEVIKELERQHARLESLSQRPQVDHAQLDSILRNLKSRIAEMQQITGQFGKSLQSVDLINVIKQKMSLPGVICDFDLPAFRYWQSCDKSIRTGHLQTWIEPFRDLDRAVSLILDVVRHSAGESAETAASGFYQQTLDTSQSIMLLRINLPHGCDFYPEISAGKHRFSVRFMKHEDPGARPDQVDRDVEFGLQMCSI